jgi:hypothetical protein
MLEYLSELKSKMLKMQIKNERERMKGWNNERIT